MTRSLARTAVTFAVAAVAVSACTPEQPIIDYGPAVPPPGPSSAPSSAGPPAGEDFFAVLRHGERADLVPEPASLTEAYADATAVIEADVSGVGPGRVVSKPPLLEVAIDLRPVRVLHGTLPPGSDRIRVEFIASVPADDPGATVGRMNADLPGRGIWLLHKPASATHYELLHPNTGVFVQGPAHVEAPSAQRLPARGARAEAQRFATLDELAAHAVSS
jgi:hypothetical protein